MEGIEFCNRGVGDLSLGDTVRFISLHCKTTIRVRSKFTLVVAVWLSTHILCY